MSRTVTTVRGKTALRSECKKIKENYYIVNEDCFLIDDRWYRYDSNLIVYDHYLQKYIKKANIGSLKYGIVDYNIKLKSFVEGYFTECLTENIITNIYNVNSNALVLNENVLLKAGYIEINKNWYPKELKGRVQLSKKVHTEKGYNLEDNETEVIIKNKTFSEYKTPYSCFAKTYYKYLGNISFGIEIETNAGEVPERILYRTGTVICRDGSISNAEYVTVPMTGLKGLGNIEYLASELSKRATIDEHCSFHIHIGNISTNRMFLMSLYSLCYKIQDELFKMFPYYKTNYTICNKRKNYNQKLIKLGIHANNYKDHKDFIQKQYESYCRLYYFLNLGQPPGKSFNRVNKKHVKRDKWNISSRYYWINFINSIFSNRNTIEFRLHQGTLNGDKMMLWLFMCNAILKYAEVYASKTLNPEINISVKEVLDFYKNFYKTEKSKKLSYLLNSYFEDRVKYFNNLKIIKDHAALDDIKTDKTFKFI